jgi:glycine dehydrogenase
MATNDLIEKARLAGIHVGVDVGSRIPGRRGNFLLISFSDMQNKADLVKLESFFASVFGKPQAAKAKPAEVPAKLVRRSSIPLPKISVDELKRYYTLLGEQNVSPDDNIYALGSCTMKYNPYINDWAAALEGFTSLHPQAPEADCQGALEVMWETQEWFKKITGLAAVTTQPVAGAQGELVGIKLFQAYHRARGDNGRDVVLIPRSAHGTNPATATMAGFITREGEQASGVVLIESSSSGEIDFSHLKELVAKFGQRIAGVMVTNPNTSGIFETRFREMADLIHQVGGLVYMDGANMNAIAGWVDLGKLGVDAVHNNTHKTWTIPHGGGGPGDAFVAVSSKLVDFLPGVQVMKEDGAFHTVKPAFSIGSFHRHYGNFAHKVRCYTYLRALGREGVKKMSAVAVLSANYLFQDLKKTYPSLPNGSESTPRMHEFILTLSKEMFAAAEANGLKKSDVIPRVGKLFLDFGLHAPTVAFPEVYGLMIEPTESYSKAELDRFLAIVHAIHGLVEKNPEVLTTVPHFTPIDKVDEVGANKDLCLSEQITKLATPLPNRISSQELDRMAVTDIAARIVTAHKAARS